MTMDTRKKLKKVTKTLAKEIAAKFFGRTVKPVEDDSERRRTLFGYEYRFKCGAVSLCVFSAYGGAGKDFEYPNEYPYAQFFINNECFGCLKYVDGELEAEH